MREETGTAEDARMWEIAENLHRAELTALERNEHIAEWVRLCERRQKEVSAQIAQKPGGRPEGGISAASRELGIDRTEASRAVKVAENLAPEAKAEARALGLDDNQSALLRAADKPDADSQITALRKHNVDKVIKAAAQLSPQAWALFWDWAVEYNEISGRYLKGHFRH